MEEIQPPIDLNNVATEVIPDVAAGIVCPVVTPPLPSFFIVGPPRTGSSWLYEVLRSRTVLPSPLKETRFFDTHFHRGLKWYLSHYENLAEGRQMGEVAPTYFASTEARERMAGMVPNAKIICVFRNPVERLFSLYRLKRAYGMIPWSFEQAIDRDPEMMASSGYGSNLRLWRDSFGENNVWAGIYDDLLDSPQMFMDSLLDFIGVPRFELEALHCGLVHASELMTIPRSYYRTRTALLIADWLKAHRLDRLMAALNRSRLRYLALGGGQPFARPPLEIARRLHERLRPEVEELEAIMQRDLSAWQPRRAARAG